MKVWGMDGKEYYDFMGGVAVNCLGHCHPKIVIALQKQAQRLIHVSNYFHIEPQTKLAKVLVKHSFADKVFFCNSGTEANEAAIKLARRYFREVMNQNRYEIITANGSFHGRTYGSLSATGQEKIRAGFEPVVPGFKYVNFNDIEALEQAVGKETCAVMLEPIQGESGVRMPSSDYLKKVRELCDRENILLILDEIQTGMGRTGKLFAYEHYGIEPDIMTLAKGLGSGVPIGAMLAKNAVAAAFTPASHGSTFGGNPLACAVGLTTVELLLEDGFFLDSCRRMGAYLMKKLGELKEEFPSFIVEVRGMGLLVGMEIVRDCAPIVKECLSKGVLINCTAGNVLRFMPALIVSEEEIDILLDILETCFDRMG